MSDISNLSPQLLWQFFDKICSIPHPSKHEEKVAQFIVDWASSEGLEVRRDEVGNIFIKKPATPGFENRRGVVLQAHMDMVPQKNEDTEHDFLTDPIQAYVDGEWVTARGTTLGADNGIGLASCLAVLADKTVEHGPLEVLVTIDEEAGMTGAFGLQQGWLEGDILLNTDSEEEGEVYMGCAGGVNAHMTFNVERQDIPAGHVAVQLQLKGLRGGHSGCDIHTGRGNANKLLARFLSGHAEELGLKIAEITGGTLRNAIPREAFTVVALPEENKQKLADLFAHFEAMVKEELAAVEPSIEMNINAAEAQTVLAPQDQARFIAALNACPNGVIRMSDDIKGVVETSLNVGVITTEGNTITVLCLIRSLIDTGRDMVEGMLASVAELAGADIAFDGAYPGWKPDPDSQIMHLFRETYEEMYGRIPNINVIHAGLECGLFKKPYPDMDMISFGPTITGAHSPDEQVNIKDVALYWDQLVTLLKRIPEKA
ncbi:aminoacyl-histidine dipeptidase [Parasalinivibrio latis]|uniref:aminoacyl-histidine dipeptidase n=1 Tax=Parasalinivibrio latis TaxID=2952610 RepID=UPI0030E2A8F5